MLFLGNNAYANETSEVTTNTNSETTSELVTQPELVVDDNLTETLKNEETVSAVEKTAETANVDTPALEAPTDTTPVVAEKNEEPKLVTKSYKPTNTVPVSSKMERPSNEGQKFTEGTGFRMNSNAVLNSVGTEVNTISEFSTNPKYYYLSTHDVGQAGKGSPIGSIWEYNPDKNNVSLITTDFMEGGGTLRDFIKNNSIGMKLIDDTGNEFTADKYYNDAKFNAMGLSKDGKKAYAVVFIGNNMKDTNASKNTVQGIYEYNLDTKKWKAALLHNQFGSEAPFHRTNSWVAGAVNPKDGNFYFSTNTRDWDPNFSEKLPSNPNEIQEWVTNGKFDHYFRIWSFNPTTNQLKSVGYMDTRFVKDDLFDYGTTPKNEYKGNLSFNTDMAFDYDGNMRFLIAQAGKPNGYIYTVKASEVDKANSIGNKYNELAHIRSFKLNVAAFDQGGGTNAVGVNGIGIDSDGNLVYSDRNKIAYINIDKASATPGLAEGDILYTFTGPNGDYLWGDGSSRPNKTIKGNVYQEYYIENLDTKLTGEKGIYLDGKFVPRGGNTTGTDTVVADKIVRIPYSSEPPLAIKVSEDEIYVLVTDDNGAPLLRNDSDKQIGEVRKNDQFVKYQYKKVIKEGDVIVKYVDIDTLRDQATGLKTEIQPQVADENNKEYKTSYDTGVDNKPDTIVTEDGKHYKFIKHDDTSDTETGTITKPLTTVVYEYGLLTGGVVVNYEDTEGNILQNQKTDSPADTPTGNTYDTRDGGLKPTELTKGDKQYELVEKLTRGDETGKIVPGTKEVTYVYKEKPKGEVIINYIDEDGNIIRDAVVDTKPTYITNGNVVEYNATENENKPEAEQEKPQTITTPNGDKYELVPTKTADTTDGAKFINIRDAKPAETGPVVEGTTHVTYVYKKVPKGSVFVNYINEQGEVIKPKETDTDKAFVDTPYDTKDQNMKPAEITHSGKEYVLVPNKTADTKDGITFGTIKEEAPKETGEVAKEDINVTYVYKEKPKGEVVINYIDESGNVIQPSVVDTEPTYLNEGKDVTYDATQGIEKPQFITTPSGDKYELVPAKTAETKDGKVFEPVKDGNPAEKGNVVEGTTHVTYVYKKVTQKADLTFYLQKEDGTEVPFDGKNGLDNIPVVAVQGKEGELVRFPTQKPQTEDLVKKGYVVVSEYGTNENFDNVADTDTNLSQHMKVVVKERVVPITEPKVPGTPVDPNDPSTPNYPEPKVPENPADPNSPLRPATPEDMKFTETVTRTVKYYKTDENGENPVHVPELDKTETVTFTRTAEINLVTGEVKFSNWSAKDNDSTLNGNVLPSIFDYEVFKADGDSATPEATTVDKTVDATSADIVENVYYKPVVGSVIVNYVDESGNAIKDPYVDTKDNTPVGTPYNTTEAGEKPAEITTKDGKEYVFVKVKEDSAPEKGQVKKEETHVTYVYKEKPKGDVVVNYIDIDGNVIKDKVTDTEPSYVGKEYNTADDNKPSTIEFEGKTYEIVPVLTKGNEQGKVVEGTTEVTYVYKEVVKQGDVIVHYTDTEGNVIKGTVVDTKPSRVGTDYSTTDNKPETIMVGEDKYVLVPSLTKGTEEGKVVEGTTEITYVYQKVANWIPLIPGESNPPKTEYPFDPAKPEDPINPIKEDPNKPGTPVVPFVPGYEPLVPQDPKDPNSPKVPLTPVDPTDPSKGYIPPVPAEPSKDTFIPYEPIKEGKVIVHYVDTEGHTIKSTVTDTPKSKVDTPYDTTDNKPESIMVGDSKYVLVPSKTVGMENGKVVEGTTEITYVYQKVANWIPLIPGESNPPKTPYPFDPANPEDPIKPIPTNPDQPGNPPVVPFVPGYEPRVPQDPKDPTSPLVPLTPVDPTDPSKGYIPPVPADSGKDTYIPYVPVKEGSVHVHYVDTDGNVIKSEVVDTPKTNVDTPYDTTDNRPETIQVDEVTYILIPSRTFGMEQGKVVEGRTDITYVYQKVANWIPLIPGEPNPPKTPYPFDPTKPEDPIKPIPSDPNKPGNPPVVPFVPGYEPELPLKPVDPNDPTKGYIPPVPTDIGEDTYIPYKPIETVAKEGVVIVEYKDVNGNVIKSPVTDMPNTPVDTPYDTTDNKPTEITFNHAKYILIPSKTIGMEQGKVVEGKTVVTYIYQKVANWIPLIPGEPKPPKTPYPFDPAKPEDPIKPIPNDPTKPGNPPVVPFVPGYQPVDPMTNEPLKPKVPGDPTQGYIPPVPADLGRDTFIPYVPLTPEKPQPSIPDTPSNPENPTPPTSPEPSTQTGPAPVKMTELPKTGDAGTVAATGLGIGSILASLGLVAPRHKKD